MAYQVREPLAETRWWERAACADEDPDLFFPVGTSGPGLEEREAAKRICRRCPVTAECLRWALTLGRPSGVWGGLDEDERAALTDGPAASATGRKPLRTGSRHRP